MTEVRRGVKSDIYIYIFIRKKNRAAVEGESRREKGEK